jgi:energy-coupling factor transporter ATP-binding protein EcfA2
MIIGGVLGLDDERYKPTSGRVEAPGNVRLAALLPGELEPEFGSETLLEHMTRKTGDPAVAVEVLNAVGLSDAIFYRARFDELSTGQKERAKLASLLAERPNLLVIDEFTAHLDRLTAQRVARKLGRLVRAAGITAIISTNRPEVLEALAPDKIVLVGYGTATMVEPEDAVDLLVSGLDTLGLNRHLLLADREQVLVVAGLSQAGSIYKTLTNLREKPTYAEISHSYSSLPGSDSVLEIQRYEFKPVSSHQVRNAGNVRLPRGLKTKGRLGAFTYIFPVKGVLFRPLSNHSGNFIELCLGDCFRHCRYSTKGPDN